MDVHLLLNLFEIKLHWFLLQRVPSVQVAVQCALSVGGQQCRHSDSIIKELVWLIAGH